LPNRAFFLELTAQQLLNAKRNRDGLGMGFIDLDNFKQVNDRYGHDFGDFVLKETAMRLKNTLRHSDIVARIGGDEFALVISGISQTEGLNAVAKKIIEACRMPLQRDGSEVTIKLSVGLSLYPRDGETVEELLFTSDTAMYRAKQRGKNDFAVYASTMTPGSL
jgi:diguanylate cyclase